MKWFSRAKKPEVQPVQAKEFPKLEITCESDMVYAKISWPLVNETNDSAVVEMTTQIVAMIVTSVSGYFMECLKSAVFKFGREANQNKVATFLGAAIELHCANLKKKVGPLVKPSETFKGQVANNG